MSRRFMIGMVLLISAALIYPVWAFDRGIDVERPADGQPRQREGGQPLPPQGDRTGGQQGTEDGLPEAGIESFDRRERFRPQPGWRLGVYAYNTPTGVVITRVIPGSPAARVGFEPGDRIVTVSGYQVGVVDNQVFYLGEELQRRADRRGSVRLLAQNMRNNRLLNLDVRLEPRRNTIPASRIPPGPRVGIRFDR